MAVRPKLSNTMPSLSQCPRRVDPRQTELQFDPKELYREACEDGDGTRYTVIVWRLYPDLARTDYTLDDGSPVTFVDDCHFEIESTGTFITRCL